MSQPARGALPARRVTGMLLSAGVCAAALLAPLPGLAPAGHLALALTLFAAIWWSFGIVHPAYTSLALCLGAIVSGLAPAEDVFRLWVSPLMWLMVAAFLIAAAVAKVGLARRLALLAMVRLATSHRSIVVLAYVLGAGLSLLIPQPFPRTLLIMAVIGEILRRAGVNARDEAALGFAVLSAGTATSTIFLTGDALLNGAAVALSGAPIGWVEWLTYMGPPGLVAALLMLGLHLVVFRPTGRLMMDRDALREELRQLGRLSRAEITTLGWLLAAVVLWTTDSIHHVHPAWVALGVVVGLAAPYVGEVLEPQDITSGVSWPILFFVAGALAIGAIGSASGLSAWVAERALPAQAPADPVMLALLIGAATLAVHMVVGSSLATMAVVMPPLVTYAASGGYSPIVTALLVYTTVAIHYLLPFHNVLILLGAGEAGRYGVRETLLYGIPLTLVLFAVLALVQIPWWRLIGLL